MASATFNERRGRIETYFDRTARDAWTQMTSDAPLSRVRATVRAGRASMSDTILHWLPGDLRGQTLLDAGCGTGAMAVQLALRGGNVRGVDVSAGLIEVARARAPAELACGRVEFHCGDMLDAGFGEVDHVVAMDSLIHYETADALAAIARLADRTRASMVFTMAPRTPALAIMHAAGKLFPRGNRAPAIVPAAIPSMLQRLAAHPGLRHWQVTRHRRISSGFYISHAIEMRRISPVIAMRRQ